MADIPPVIGRYEIISRLGQGGMGSLYLSKDPRIGRLVAIKLVRQEFDSPEARQRFAREAQSAGALRHPNIVTIFDVDEYEGLPYIAMEYVDGETLSEIVRRKAPLTIAKRLQWIEALCSGLAYAHRQGVVHRDVKPANLMLDNEGALKILDFGLARREASKFTQSQTVIGTPNYMSPEQIRAGDVGPASDIFAVGAVLYEVLAYVEAFPGKVHQAMHKILHEEPRPLNQVMPGIDSGIVTILARALEKDPARRFADLTVMRTELALVRQRLEHRGEEGAATISLTPTLLVPRSSGSGAGHTPSSGAPGSTPGSGGSRRVSAGAHRVTLQKKRAAQIDLHLVEARKHCDAGAFDKARTEVEQALMFDPDHPTGLQLIDEIAAEEERQQVAQFVAAARVELQQGRLEAAEQIVAQALEIAPQSPEVLQLRETIETARREIERARQVQDMLRRARTRFSEGSFEGAIRAVGELLAIDPGNAAARDLQTRAQDAMDARAHRVERDAAAQATVTEARALFEKGDKESAIATLEAFTPPHDLVSGFLASLRSEQVAEALQDRARTDPVPMAALRAPAATGAAPHAGSRSRTPVYAGAAVAVVVLVGIAWKISTGRDAGSVSPEPTAAAATSTAPPPVIPPPAVVTPPASLSDQPPQNQSDRDAMSAYKLLSAGRHAEAAKIAAQIARRDPKNENLEELRAQIQVVADTEKQRAAAIAASSSPAPGAPGPASPAAAGSTDKPAAPGSTGDPVSTSAGASDKPAVPPAAPAARPDLPVPPAASAPAAAPPPAPSAAEVERPAIEASIQEYAKALSSMSLPAVARVRKYTAAEAKNWENTFKQLTEYRLIVKITGNPTVDGERATIPVEEQFAQTSKKGGIQVFSQARKTEYKLEKIGGKWMLLPPG